MGYLQSVDRRRFLTGRGAILSGIVALHGLAIIVLANAGMRQKLVEVTAPIEVSFLQEYETSPAPPPIAPKLAEIKPVDMVLPEFSLPPEANAPTAITVIPPRTNAAPSVANADVPVVVDTVEYMRPPKPRYPPSAKSARVQGVVMLRVLIDRDGLPCDVRVHRSSGSPQLDAAARESVLEARFRPHRENGVARTAQVLIPIEFSLTIRTASRS